MSMRDAMPSFTNDRTATSITTYQGELAVLANDGTMWKLHYWQQDNRYGWIQLPPLPSKFGPDPDTVVPHRRFDVV